MADAKKEGVVLFDVLDVVGREGVGVGSAGLATYNVLIEGFLTTPSAAGRSPRLRRPDRSPSYCGGSTR